MKKLTFIFIVFLFLNSHVYAGGFANTADFKHSQASDGEMMAEILVRPIAAIGTVVGIATFLVSFPFSAIAENNEEAYDKLVVDPFQYTFNRPVGYYPTK